MNSYLSMCSIFGLHEIITIEEYQTGILDQRTWFIKQSRSFYILLTEEKT